MRKGYIEIGQQLARQLFERRGNNREVHLSEAELAGLLAMAAEKGGAAGTRAALDEALNSGDGSYRP